MNETYKCPQCGWSGAYTDVCPTAGCLTLGSELELVTGVKMYGSYICAACKGTFLRNRPVEEADQENWELRGADRSMEPCVEVCDDCYNIIMENMNK